MATLATQDTAILQHLGEIVGEAHLLTGEDERRFYATDVYSTGALPAAVVRPQSVGQLQRVVTACTQHKVPVAIRGGGASYTNGYLHRAPDGITIDMRHLDAIEVDEVNQTVTVEAGCSWAKLYEHLKERGLRTPFWGPFSGLAASVGGSVSQHAISHGTGAFGISAESVLGLEVITGEGEMLRLGARGQDDGAPFFRFYGPDLVGLFTGDCGAFGVKARVTLRLIRRREAFQAVSLSFDNFAAMHSAMRAIALEHVDDENFGLDAALQQGQIGRQKGARAKAEIARSVLGSAGSLRKGMATLARMAAAGEAALRRVDYAVHYIAEGEDEAAAKAKAETIRRIGGEFGSEIANTVPTVVRGMPFAPLTNALGPEGERWVPMHGLFAHDQVLAFHEAINRVWDERRAEMERMKVTNGAMFMAIGASAFVYEPAFYWPDEQTHYHHREVPETHLRSLTRHEANPEAKALVARLREEIAGLMQRHGAAHLQIGKVYPYLDRQDALGQALLRDIKTRLDPHGIFSPGALGL